MDFLFEWDEAKARANARKHKVTFEEAVSVFTDPLLVTFPDEEHSEIEERSMSIGRSDRGRILSSIPTVRMLFDSLVAARQPQRSAQPMSSNAQNPADRDDDLLPEYDFSGKTGVRGKYYQRLRQGYTIKIHRADGTTLVQQITRPEGTVTLDPDVQAYFPDAEAVNTALRGLIELIPAKKTKRTATTQAPTKSKSS